MTTNHEHDGEDELQAARRTAHALGQTSEAEQAEVAAELAASPQARQEFEAVEAMAARLKEAASKVPQPEPSPALREAIERRLDELEPAAGRAAGQTKARPWWRNRTAALAVTAACLAALAPIIWSIDFLGPRKERNVAQGIMYQDNMVSELKRDLQGIAESSKPSQIDDAPLKELAADPTPEKPAMTAPAAGYFELIDDSKSGDRKGGGAAGGGMPANAHASGGALAFGPGPKFAGFPRAMAGTVYSGGGGNGQAGHYAGGTGIQAGHLILAGTNSVAGLVGGAAIDGPNTQTWTPAHVVPNSSRLMVGDKEELPLRGMQVDVRVDGFRARVLIDLYYFNDRPQQLEGNFQLRLPDEASPYFFAFGRTVYQAPQVTASNSMFFKPQQVSQGDTTPEKILELRGNSWEQPKVARMVPREKAALAYRDTVRRRVDPALVEWSGAGVFQCRVFPLAPQSLHRVTIGYDVDLVRVSDDLELRLDLPGQTPATIVDLNIAASDARQVSLDAPATTSADGQRLMYRLVDPKDRPLAVRLRKPGTQMLTGADEATGNYFATRVGLSLPETPAAERAKQAIFLVDTSLSAGPQFPLWTKLLRAALENNRDSIQEFSVVFFNVETFWWQEKFVANTPENVESLTNYANSLALEGATDLGRAIQEAASPAWLKKGGVGLSPAPNLFLLSDGAATWGEDRWPLLAAPLTPGPSPATMLRTVPGEGSSALTPGPSPKTGEGSRSSLFAYRTGLAGGDPRLLAYLAEQTGGAVFSLVGEAEIASASVAHRNRPWRLTGIEMAGGHDLLVAGRPQYVFPGQQLLVVGRLEQHRADQSDRADQRSLAFTLQQGKATQTISVKMDQVLTSELAASTFGQVATSQLEDVCSAAAAAEPVATAYARHFRVTGRTCSLLMLESEQDYTRFNIKPEEDSFVVKDRFAGTIVAKAVAETVASMSDPKAIFLAWYRRVREASEVHFDLPAALNVALEGLPAETFAVVAPSLQCKLRMRNNLPENLRQPWQSGLPDYETLAAEAQRRLTAYGADDALRGLSSLVEDRPGDAALARDLAFSAIEWQRPGEAYHLLRRAATARTFEPITFHAMAHCLEQMGRADLAMVYYELACGGQWDGRFGDIHNIAQLDYLRFLRRVTDGRSKASLAKYAKARLATLAAMQLRETADVAALMFWNTDGTDVDLHVIEPSGEECFYQHTQTASGGHISRDVTTGYGPELYLLPKAPAGNYRVSAHYFAADANRTSTRTKVLALIYEGWGTKDEKVTMKALALTGRSENHELGMVKR